MKESHIEGVATHDDPESCADGCEAGREALTGAHTGSVLSREITISEEPTLLCKAEGETSQRRYSKSQGGLARSQTRHMCGTSLRENREIPSSPVADGATGRSGKAFGQTPEMHGGGKSDRFVLPTKSPNKTEGAVAEAMEGRSLIKGNTGKQNAPRTQSRLGAHSALDRVRKVAKTDKKIRFTALLHHVSIDRLRAAYFSLKKDAAAGVDGVTWKHYGERLEENLQGLHTRVHSRAYRAKPSRRVYIPKSDGRQRPLGIAALEDKVLQRAVVEVMNAIYESDFLGFSYGFRPGRGAHDALDALAVGILRKKVNWVLDADIRGFFDAIDHEWLVKFIEHRIADRRVLRLIQKWLRAGVVEQGKRLATDVGSPQGATVSPLLANICMHYALDLWAEQWRRKRGHGDIVIVRYADDFLLGFQHRTDALQFLTELRERLARFKLELYPDKTRLLCFGRYASSRRKERGQSGAPQTFDFLGLTHYCGCSRNGKFLLQRRTMRTRLRDKVRDITLELRRRLHQTIEQQGRWLGSVVRGHYAYYGVPTNIYALEAFRQAVTKCWYRSLRRRSQRHRLNWVRMHRLAVRWLPTARIVHPWPEQRFDVRTRDKSPVQ
jgi:RNA-directed DNA polymerase